MAMPRRNNNKNKSNNTMSKRLSKLERSVANDVPELKYRVYDISLESTMSFKADLYPLVQGSAINQRIGNSVRFVSLEARFRLRNDSTTYSPIVRSLLILDTANANSSVPYTDDELFSSAGSYIPVSSVRHDQVGRGKRFRILRDITQNLSIDESGPGTTRTLIYKMPLNMRVSYNANVDSTTSLPNRSLVFAQYCDGAIDIRGTMTIYFEDA
jgi:hypothetical protein